MNVRQLQIAADQMRLDILDEITTAQSGHIGGALSICELLAVLYGEHMKIRPEEPAWPDRDRLVLSKGHASSALYAALAAHGYFDRAELKKFRSIDGILQGHPSMTKTPGVDMSSGSLGQGLSCANGMALAGRVDHKTYRVYCICGDGEMQEGQIWEAAMLAGSRKLDNFIAFTDYNKMQLDGYIEDVNGLYPLEKKWESFGWYVQSVDGHDVGEIAYAIDNAKKIKGRPSMIILNTIKGKGGFFCENMVASHNMNISEETWKKAVELLDKEEA